MKQFKVNGGLEKDKTKIKWKIREYRLSIEKIVYCFPGYIHLMSISFIIHIYMFWGPGWLNELGRWI